MSVLVSYLIHPTSVLVSDLIHSSSVTVSLCVSVLSVCLSMLFGALVVASRTDSDVLHWGWRLALTAASCIENA